MIRETLLKSVSLLVSNIKQATVNITGKGTQVKSELYDMQVGNNNRYNVNYSLPYGFTSVPIDGTPALVANVGVGGNNAVVLGSIQTSQPKDILHTLSSGESAIWSNKGYVLLAKNSKVGYLYKGEEATACSGEDVQTILIDLCTQIEDLYSQLNGVYSQLNSHSHIETDSGRTESMSSSGTTLSSGQANEEVISDKSFCEGGKLLIDENGVTPVR